MPVLKRVLCKERLRKVPQQFSWIDHRLVRDGHVSRCSTNALALYLFLVTVADAQGLSYYADKTLCRLLRLDLGILGSARAELIANRLIAWQAPLYQVLALGPASPPMRWQHHQRRDSQSPSTSSGQAGEAQCFADILRQLTNPVQDKPLDSTQEKP